MVFLTARGIKVYGLLIIRRFCDFNYSTLCIEEYYCVVFQIRNIFELIKKDKHNNATTTKYY